MYTLLAVKMTARTVTVIKPGVLKYVPMSSTEAFIGVTGCDERFCDRMCR